MAFTYDLSTDRGKVRLLIADTDKQTEANQIFEDDEIDAFLALEGSDVRLAAARALGVMAANQVLVLKVIRILDLQTDGAAVARELRQQAKQLREEAEAGDFDVVEMVTDPFTYRERLWNELMREVG